jgi:hypothetical protein
MGIHVGGSDGVKIRIAMTGDVDGTHADFKCSRLRELWNYVGSFSIRPMATAPFPECMPMTGEISVM